MSLRLLASLLLLLCYVDASTNDEISTPRVNSLSYYEVTKETMTSGEAQAACKANGDRLAMIENSEEEGLAIQACKSRCWIGLRDVKNEGERVFVWPDGTPMSYNGFRKNEPNNYGGVKEDCVELDVRKTYLGWNDIPCSDNTLIVGALCEKRFGITFDIQPKKQIFKVGEKFSIEYRWLAGSAPSSNPRIGLTPIGINNASEALNGKYYVTDKFFRPTKATGSGQLSCTKPGYYDVKAFDTDTCCAGRQVGSTIRVLCTTDGLAEQWPSTLASAPCANGATVLMDKDGGSPGRATAMYALIGAGVGSVCVFGVACCVLSRKSMRGGYDTIH